MSRGWRHGVALLTPVVPGHRVHVRRGTRRALCLLAPVVAGDRLQVRPLPTTYLDGAAFDLFALNNRNLAHLDLGNGLPGRRAFAFFPRLQAPPIGWWPLTVSAVP